jgi:hypothetical protein
MRQSIRAFARVVFCVGAFGASAAVFSQSPPPPVTPSLQRVAPIAAAERVYQAPVDGKLPEQRAKAPDAKLPLPTAAAAPDPRTTGNVTPLVCGQGCEQQISDGFESCEGHVEVIAQAQGLKAAPAIPGCREKLFKVYEQCLASCGTPNPLPHKGVAPRPPVAGGKP